MGKTGRPGLRKGEASARIGAKDGLSAEECAAFIRSVQEADRREFLMFLYDGENPPGVRDEQHLAHLYVRYFRLKRASLEPALAELGSGTFG